MSVTQEMSRPVSTLVERAARRAIDGLAQDSDATRERLVDAAYEEFCRVGIAKASMDGIAKRAGTSRVTVYRKFDTKDALVDEVIAREFARYLTEFRQTVAIPTTLAERVVTAFVASIERVAANPLIKRMLDDNPAVVPGLIGGGDGRNLDAVSEFVCAALRSEQAAGNLGSDIDVALAAEMVVRISGSCLTVRSRLIDHDDVGQLERVARACILPMLGVS